MSAVPTPVTSKSDDRTLMDAQQSLVDIARALNAIPLLDGRLIDNAIVTAAAFDVDHGLGRAFRGYIIVRCYGTAFALAEAIPQPDPTRTIRLASTADSVGALWVF